MLCGTAPSRPGAIRLPSGSSSPALAKRESDLATQRGDGQGLAAPAQLGRASVRCSVVAIVRAELRRAVPRASVDSASTRATRRIAATVPAATAHLGQLGRRLRAPQAKQRVVARHERETLAPQPRQRQRQLAVGIATAQRDAAAFDLGGAQRDADAARQPSARSIASCQRLARSQRRRIEQRQAASGRLLALDRRVEAEPARAVGPRHHEAVIEPGFAGEGQQVGVARRGPDHEQRVRPGTAEHASENARLHRHRLGVSRRPIRSAGSDRPM